jgi:hypothetical protein
LLPEGGEASLEQRGEVFVVAGHVPDDSAAVADRRLCELVEKTKLLCEVGGFAIGQPRGGCIAGPGLRVSECNQQLATCGVVTSQRQRQSIEACRLLVRRQSRSMVAGASGVIGCLLDVTGRCGLGEVKCELREM